MLRAVLDILAAPLVALLAWADVLPNALPLQRQLVLAENTIWLGVCVTLLATPLGLLIALVWLKTNLPLRRMGLVVLLTLMFVPLYVQASAWQAGFGQLGWYTVGQQRMNAPLLSGWQATVWVHVASAAPWAALIIGIGLATVERESEEAALLETGLGRVLWWITMPLIAAWIAIAAIWTAVSAAVELVVVDLFQVDTYARYLYTTFAQSEPNASAFEVLIAPSVVGVTLIGIALWLAVRRSPAGLRELRVPPLQCNLGRMRLIVFGLVVGILMVLTVVPLGNLLYQAGFRTGSTGAAHWSASALGRALMNGWIEFHDELQWTFIIAALSATLSLAAAVTAVSIIGRRRRLAALFWILAAFLVSVPAPLIGLWLIPVVVQSEWDWLYRLHYESVFSPVLVAALRSWPTLFVLCWLAARDVPRDVHDLARLDAARGRQFFQNISAPLLWPAWALSWLVGFALSAGELAATLMVLPPGAATVATRVYGLIHSGVREKEAALCLWNVVASVVLVMIVLRLYESRLSMWRATNTPVQL